MRVAEGCHQDGMEAFDLRRCRGQGQTDLSDLRQLRNSQTPERKALAGEVQTLSCALYAHIGLMAE
jgi:hypothetical protein